MCSFSLHADYSFPELKLIPAFPVLFFHTLFHLYPSISFFSGFHFRFTIDIKKHVSREVMAYG